MVDLRRWVRRELVATLPIDVAGSLRPPSPMPLNPREGSIRRSPRRARAEIGASRGGNVGLSRSTSPGVIEAIVRRNHVDCFRLQAAHR